MRYRLVRYFLALSAALFAFHASVMAASSDELTDIRNQLHDLLLRVDRQHVWFPAMPADRATSGIA